MEIGKGKMVNEIKFHSRAIKGNNTERMLSQSICPVDFHFENAVGQ